MLACVLEILSAVFLICVPNSQHLYFLVSIIGFGMGYSVFVGAYWSMIPYVVGREYLGTAFGVCESVNNLGRFLFIMVMGSLEPSVDDSNLSGYTYVSI